MSFPIQCVVCSTVRALRTTRNHFNALNRGVLTNVPTNLGNQLPIQSPSRRNALHAKQNQHPIGSDKESRPHSGYDDYTVGHAIRNVIEPVPSPPPGSGAAP